MAELHDPVDRRNDPITDEVERVSRELCEATEQDPDEIVEGEPWWRHPTMVGKAENAIDSWRVLTGR